ncbi:hypothetical protein ABW21_db0201091 [Orbilia brochopaga]|nr:hypothetical protein ABW21_db0201091 [Drechslerella brochopaga]
MSTFYGKLKYCFVFLTLAVLSSAAPVITSDPLIAKRGITFSSCYYPCRPAGGDLITMQESSSPDSLIPMQQPGGMGTQNQPLPNSAGDRITVTDPSASSQSQSIPLVQQASLLNPVYGTSTEEGESGTTQRMGVIGVTSASTGLGLSGASPLLNGPGQL